MTTLGGTISDKFVNRWTGNDVILTTFLSMAAPKVVKMTTFGAASDKSVVKITKFRCQWFSVSITEIPLEETPEQCCIYFYFRYISWLFVTETL